MYYICKKYVQKVKDMALNPRTQNGNTIYFMDDWKDKSILLNKLANIPAIREKVKILYETIPVIYRDQNKFDISREQKSKFQVARDNLVVSMETIIELYESINTNKIENKNIVGFDVKLPAFEDVGEFSKCLEDLDFILKRCPYLRNTDCEIKYGSIDVGSTWLTFLVVGALGTTILTNLGKLVDTAVKIKSHFVTVKTQEELLQSIKIKNETAAEVLDVFKKLNRAFTDKYVEELEKELGELADGEEKDVMGRCLEKLSIWMNKGLQIYSSIEAPKEVKDVFPEQQDLSFLTDDIQKLIEEKEQKK